MADYGCTTQQAKINKICHYVSVFGTRIMLDIRKVPMKWTDITFNKLCCYAC